MHTGIQNSQNWKTHSSALIVTGAICCFAGCIGDFVITFLLGFATPGYDFLNESQSILGRSSSSVGLYMKIWGVVFSFLFVAYGLVLNETIFSKGFWARLVAWLIIIYGLGEGVGSGLFPYDHIGTKLTLSGKLHSLFSGIGVGALVCLSFALMKVFPKQQYSRMNTFVKIVSFSSLVLIVAFLLARQNLIPLRGLWQRLFLLGYYSLLVVIACRLLFAHFKDTSYLRSNNRP